MNSMTCQILECSRCPVRFLRSSGQYRWMGYELVCAACAEEQAKQEMKMEEANDH